MCSWVTVGRDHEYVTDEMSGDDLRRWGKMDGAAPIHTLAPAAGDHPNAPVRVFSQRTAYRSVRARNRSANKASLSATGEAMVTIPGAATGADSCSGDGTVS
jgi:hypothetical protein